MNSESRNQNPQEKAQAYVDRKHGDGPESAGQRSAAPEENPSKSGRRRTPEQWHDLISQRIEEAMRNGAFENLPGKGKPLDTRPEPFVPTDMQMANSLLKNNDLVPAWISDRRLLLGAIDQFRTRLVDTAAVYQADLEAATTAEQRDELLATWNRQVHAWRDEVTALNRRIDVQNLRQPAIFLEIFKLRLEDELKRLGAPLER